MEYVIDFNILFSSLLSGKALYKTVFQNFTFFIPDFTFWELQKYEEEIFEKTRLETHQMREYAKYLFMRIIVQPGIVIEQNNKQKAYNLCKNIDLKDIAYVALSLEMKIPLLTRDIPLYKELRKNKFNNVILFNDFINNKTK